MKCTGYPELSDSEVCGMNDLSILGSNVDTLIGASVGMSVEVLVICV